MPVHRTREERDISEAGDRAIREVQHAIQQAMHMSNMTEPELSEKLGQNMSQLLASDTRNLSVKAMGRIFAALGVECNIWISPPAGDAN